MQRRQGFDIGCGFWGCSILCGGGSGKEMQRRRLGCGVVV
jgi:hypothetical protein